MYALRDKNGKELKHGDRVALLNRSDETEFNATVVFGSFQSHEDEWGVSVSTLGWWLKYDDGGYAGVYEGDDKNSYGYPTSRIEKL